jgi:tRNA threonylcarbamoyl adenosine modification protein YjeE
VGDVLYLEGPLGAGKTFLTRALCRALGVDSEVPVQSPTFALIHTLEGTRAGQPLGIVHCDFYRLNSDDEVDELGLRELIAENVVVIEWGLRFQRAIGPGLVISLSLKEGVRTAEITALGEGGEAMLARL